MTTPVYIAPVGFSNPQFINRLAEHLHHILSAGVTTIDLPIQIEEAHSPDRKQFHSTKLIAQAIPLAGSYNGKIILLVDVDLFVPVLTYVFGEAMLNGSVSIVSVCRLHEEFYTGVSNEGLLFERTMKEILHELGHNFGLYHCSEWDCVMHSSAGIEEVDIKGHFYCNECRKSIQ